MVPGEPGKREIYVEFVMQGSLVKATAIESLTGVEASVFGPATASREALTHNAVAKLVYLLKKQQRE